MMRALVLISFALAFSACGEEPSAFCETAADQNAACISPNGLEQCEEANDTCPGRVLIQESCPVQFACPADEQQR